MNGWMVGWMVHNQQTNQEEEKKNVLLLFNLTLTHPLYVLS